jgi:hypothetical protein
MSAPKTSSEAIKRPCSCCGVESDYTLTWFTVLPASRDRTLGMFRVEHVCEQHLDDVVLSDDPPQRVDELPHMKSTRLARDRNARAQRRADFRKAHVPMTTTERPCTDCGLPTVDLSGLCKCCIENRRQ